MMEPLEMDTLEDFNDQAAHKLGNILLKGKILQPLSLGGLLGHTAMPEHRGEGLQLQDRSVNPELPWIPLCLHRRVRFSVPD